MVKWWRKWVNALRRFPPRLMENADVETVWAIERAASAFPWTEKTFADCLQVGYDAWVYERGDEIYGYSVMAVGAEEAHVLNICVHPDRQRQGCGRYIVRHLIKVAGRRGVHSIFLEVRPSNDRALSLYQQFGFSEIGMRKGYYPARRGREDALVLALPLAD